MQEIKNRIQKEAGSNSSITSFEKIYFGNHKSNIRKWFYGILVSLFIFLFLPWTQNIRARGAVTTLRQEYRPQQLNTIIAGRIVKWHVKEGDMVKKGDTIAQLAEIKDAYLDPQLLDRTKEQMEAKVASVSSYTDKVNATSEQMKAIEQSRGLKLEQLQNKIQQNTLKIISDSMDMIAANNDFKIAEAQYKRQLVMRDSGLASLVQVEQRNQSMQSALAKKMSAEIKLNNTRTDLTNAKIELNQTQQEYIEKYAKAQGDRAAAQSEIASGKGEISKLQNQFANYTIRNGQYFLIAPQDGQIINASKAGINEIVKEGETLLEIVPKNIGLAVEIYVKPVDLPLVEKGQRINMVFDGFPAVVFSGWPAASIGMFQGQIAAIENSVSPNGMFRVLIAQVDGEKPWPPSLKIGTGVNGIALLNDVFIWYELWRNINGFPPDFYKAQESKSIKDAKKKK
jgi:multidrug efflux pump subunit AcrA (membrane-fusion protein)